MSHAASPPRILWVGTRAPWPPHDGGRLVAALTIEALTARGAEVTVITPGGPPPPSLPGLTVVRCPDTRASWWRAAGRAAISGLPLTVARHLMPRVCQQVAAAIDATPVDLVHVEQLQAYAAATRAREVGVPIVLRLHNVESAIWRQGGGRGALWRRVLRAEARRLAAYEAAVAGEVDAVVTLSTSDALALHAATPAARVEHVPPPAPPRPTASARQQPPVLAGTPACVWIGSRGWPPNDDGMRWLRRDVWPAIQASVPDARLHVFGQPPGGDRGVTWHPAPPCSADALPPGAILLLPLRLSAGVRMRLLEAWACGVPVVASPPAVEGLETSPDEDVLVAGSPREFAAAVLRLRDDQMLRTRLVEGGAARVARLHEPARVADRLLALYADVIARRARR